MVDKGIKNKLRKLEESLWIMETRFDRDYMEDILAPDFFEFGRSGRTYSRRDTLSVMAEEIMARLPLRNFKVSSISLDVYLVTYVSEVNYGVFEFGNRCSLWSKASGRWQIHFHQGTRVPDEPVD